MCLFFCIFSLSFPQFKTYDEFLYAAMSLTAQVLSQLHSESLVALGELVKDKARGISFAGLYANLTTNKDSFVLSYFSGWDYRMSSQTFLPSFELSHDLSQVNALRPLDWPNGEGPDTNYCLFFPCVNEGNIIVAVFFYHYFHQDVMFWGAVLGAVCLSVCLSVFVIAPRFC